MPFARSLLLALALSGSAALVLAGEPAHAADTLPADGLVAFLPGGEIVGDGSTSVDLWILALNADGTPMRGLKAKMSSSEGDVGSASDQGGGLYKVSFTAPAVDAASTVTVTLKGKTPAKKAVLVSQGFSVRPAMGSSLAVSANPERITLGTGTNGTLTVQLSGNTDGADVIARSSAGSLASVVGLGGGKFTAAFTADTVNYPHLALVGVADKRAPGAAYGFTALPMDGKTDFPVTSKPNASVMMRIGDAEFGPVQADAAGKAKVPIIVPPGATTATVVTVEDGSTSESSIDLRIPETRRMLLLPVQAGFVASEGASYPVRVAVAQPQGGADSGAKVTLTATTGKFSAAKHEGSGVYAATYTPGTADTRTIATITAQVGDSPTQVDTMDVTLIPGLPGGVAISTSPEHIGKGEVAVTATVTRANGTGIAGRQVLIETTGGRVTEAASDGGDGLYKAKVDGGSSDRVEVFATVRTEPSGNGAAHILVIPGSEQLSNDGASKTSVTIVATDAEGHPVAGVPVGLQLEGTDGSLPSSVTTGPNGFARVSYTAGRDIGIAHLIATAAGHTGAASVFQAPALISPVDLPEPVSGEAKAIRDAWAARMPTVVLSKKAGSTVAAATPEGAMTRDDGTADATPEPAEPVAKPEPVAEPKPEPAPEPEPVVEKPEPAPEPEVVPEPVVPDRAEAPEGAAVTSISLAANPAEVAPGGTTTITISATDSNGAGVTGHSFELITADGKLANVEEVGNGDYTVVFTASKKASGEVRLSVASDDGPAAFKKVPVGGEAVATAKEPKAPKEPKAAKEPKTPSEPMEEKWLRVRGGFALSSYWYQQEPSDTNTVLLPDRFSVGASSGPNAMSLGFDVDARAWFIKYIGAEVHVRSTFHGVQAAVFGDQVAPDTLMLVEAHGLARYPFQAGSNSFHIGARAGVGVSDFIYYSGDADGGVVDYANFVVPSLDLGAEIGAQIGDLGLLAGFTEGLAYFSVPSRTSIDIGATYDITDPIFIHAGFGVQSRKLPVIGNNTGDEQGVITDGQLQGTIGAGIAF
ncbi:MAG: Ig-like domain-containing protein [Proteobacteria bacterium]|nr:Ig-like domain-containing protein [Pseudomonadota bacterium]